MLVGLLAAAATVTWDAWADIAYFATRDEEQSHILLVPIVAVWLAWVRRGRLRRCPRDRRWVGPLLVAAGWAMYSLGDQWHLRAVFHLGAVTITVGCFLSIAGARYLTRLLPAFCVLAFMVPVPGVVREQVALPLQGATAEATQRLLEVFGVDARRAGNALEVNGQTVLIAEACNGLRMVFALLLVSYAFAYSLPVRDPVRWFIIGLSPVTAVACNVIRLVPTVWVYGHVSASAGDAMHTVGGWLMLPIAFLVLYGIFRALRWALVPVFRYTLAYGR
jgi:exosortase